MDWKLEVVMVPVTDPDRSKAFYSEQVGFVVDHDTTVSEDTRIIQLTPPGSQCSIVLATGSMTRARRARQSLQLVVEDIEAARAQLAGNGVDVSDVRHYEGATLVEGPGGRWNSFVFFEDPDGTSWTIQERTAE